MAWRLFAVGLITSGLCGLDMINSNGARLIALCICVLYEYVSVFVCKSHPLELSIAKWQSVSIVFLLNHFTCHLRCGWYVFVHRFSPPRTQHTCWKNVELIVSPLPNKIHWGEPYTKSQVFANVCSIVHTDLLESSTVFTNLKIKSVITIWNWFIFFAVYSLSRISAATNFSVTVGGSSYMHLRSLRRVTLFFAQITQNCSTAQQTSDRCGQKKLQRKN